MSVRELKPGMRGTASITTTTMVTPVSVTEVKNCAVVTAFGTAIIVRTNNENKMFSRGDIDKRGVNSRARRGTRAHRAARSTGVASRAAREVARAIVDQIVRVHQPLVPGACRRAGDC